MSYAMTEVKVNKPLHVLAEEAIKKMIVLPEYQNGKLLPNEIELARSLHISRNTLRQAHNQDGFRRGCSPPQGIRHMGR